MRECDRLESCPFFNDRLGEITDSAALLKQQFCLGGYESCARYRVDAKLGSTSIPPDLLPGESARADRIVAGT